MLRLRKSDPHRNLPSLPSPVGASVFQPGAEDAMLKLPRCVPNEPAISPFWGPYRECNHT